MRGISLFAIILGGALDTVLSALLMVPLVISVMASHHLSHLPQDQAQSALLAAIHQDPALRVVPEVGTTGARGWP